MNTWLSLLLCLAAIAVSGRAAIPETHDCNFKDNPDVVEFIPWPSNYFMPQLECGDGNTCAMKGYCDNNNGTYQARDECTKQHNKLRCCQLKPCSAAPLAGSGHSRSGHCMLPKQCVSGAHPAVEGKCGQDLACCVDKDPQSEGIVCSAEYNKLWQKMRFAQEANIDWPVYSPDVWEEFVQNRQTNFLPYMLGPYEFLQSGNFCAPAGDCSAGNYLAFAFFTLADVTDVAGPQPVFDRIVNPEVHQRTLQLLAQSPYNGFVTPEFFGAWMDQLWAEDAPLQLRQYNSGSCSDFIRMSRAFYGDKAQWKCDDRWRILMRIQGCKASLDSNLDDCDQGRGVCHIEGHCPDPRQPLTNGDSHCQSQYGTSKAQCCSKLEPSSNRDQMELIDNEYHHLRVLVEPDVAESEEVIELIKQRFTEASHALYVATHHRASLASVEVILPESWSTQFATARKTTISTRNPEFTVRRDMSFVDDGVLIPRLTMNALQFGFCGSAGMGAYLTPKDLEGEMATINILKFFGFNRYGTFSEHPHYEFENVVPGEPYQVGRCVNDGTASIELCSGVLSISDSTGTGSINWIGDTHTVVRQNAAEIVHFCQADKCRPDTLHNDQLENTHNQVCQSRSVLDVVLENDDFRFVNPRERQVRDPEFHFLHRDFGHQSGAGEHRFALVLDKSSSMWGTFFDNQVLAVRQFIDMIDQSLAVGIAAFSSQAELVAPVTVGTEQGRQLLKEALSDVDPSGLTDIYSGLDKALEMLEQDSESSGRQGGYLVLFSDGQDGQPESYIERAQARISQLGVKVLTVSITDEADPDLKRFAEMNGGRHFLISNQGDIDEFLRQTHSILAELQSDGKSRVLLSVDHLTNVEAGEQTEHLVHLDVGLGDDTLVSVHYPEFSSMQASLQSENGQQSAQCQDEPDFLKINCRINVKPEPGVWRLTLTPQGQGSADLTVVTSSTVDLVAEMGRTVKVEGKLAKAKIEQLPDSDHELELDQSQILMATVSFGPYAVVRAKVTAYVTFEDGSRFEVELLDDGNRDGHYDLHKDDGVYTAVFEQTEQVGLYSVDYKVTADPAYYTGDVLLGIPKPEAFMDAREHLRVPITFNRLISVGTFEVTNREIKFTRSCYNDKLCPNSNDNAERCGKAFRCQVVRDQKFGVAPRLPARVKKIEMLDSRIVGDQAVFTLAWQPTWSEPSHYELIASSHLLAVTGRALQIKGETLEDRALIVTEQVQPTGGNFVVGTVQVPLSQTKNGKLYFAVAAVNKVGEDKFRRGASSNVVIESVQNLQSEQPSISRRSAKDEL